MEDNIPLGVAFEGENKHPLWKRELLRFGNKDLSIVDSRRQLHVMDATAASGGPDIVDKVSCGLLRLCRVRNVDGAGRFILPQSVVKSAGNGMIQ